MSPTQPTDPPAQARALLSPLQTKSWFHWKKGALWTKAETAHTPHISQIFLHTKNRGSRISLMANITVLQKLLLQKEKNFWD